MVSGISGNGGSSSLFLGSSFQKQGMFSVSDDNPRNLLQIDPTFKKPSTELREAEEIRRKNMGLRDEQTDNPLAAQVQAEPSLGTQSVRRLASDQTDPINIGGSAVEVSDGSVTFQSGDRSINVNEGDEARILENDDGSLTLVNRSTSQRVSFERGEQIEVSGDGEARISGTDRTTVEGGGTESEQIRSETISVSDGSTLNVSQNDRGNATLSQPDSADAIELGSQTDISISGDSGEQFTFTNNRGRSITFEAGDAGALSQNDDGTITIENESTGETETFSTDQALNTGGNARATLTNRGRDTLLFEGRDQGQFVSGGEDELELVNASTVNQTEIDPRREPPKPQRPVRIQTFDDPSSNAQSLLQNQLLAQPDDAEKSANEDEETSKNARSLDQDEADEQQKATQAASFQDQESADEIARETSEDQTRFGPDQAETDEENIVSNEGLPGENEDDENKFPIDNSEEEDIPVFGTDNGNEQTGNADNAERDNRLSEQERLRRQFSTGQSQQSGQQLNFRV